MEDNPSLESVDFYLLVKDITVDCTDEPRQSDTITFVSGTVWEVEFLHPTCVRLDCVENNSYLIIPTDDLKEHFVPYKEDTK